MHVVSHSISISKSIDYGLHGFKSIIHPDPLIIIQIIFLVINYSILRLIGSHQDQAIMTQLGEIKVLTQLSGVNYYYLYGSVF